MRDEAHDMQGRKLVAFTAAQHFPIRTDPAQRMVEEAFQPGPQTTIDIVGVQIQEQRSDGIVSREVRRAAAERAPEQTPVLARLDPAAAQRVAAVEHPHEYQAENGRERIAAALPSARVGQGGQATQQAVGVRLYGHRFHLHILVLSDVAILAQS